MRDPTSFFSIMDLLLYIHQVIINILGQKQIILWMNRKSIRKKNWGSPPRNKTCISTRTCNSNRLALAVILIMIICRFLTSCNYWIFSRSGFFLCYTLSSTKFENIFKYFIWHPIRAKPIDQFLQFAHTVSVSSSRMMASISARNLFSCSTMRAMRAFRQRMSISGRASSAST